MSKYDELSAALKRQHALYVETHDKMTQLKAERDAIKSTYDADAELIKKLEAERDRYKAALERLLDEYETYDSGECYPGTAGPIWATPSAVLNWMVGFVAETLRGEGGCGE